MSQDREVLFFQLFNTPTGQEVLKILEKRFQETLDYYDENELRHRIGQRTVIHYINQQIQRGGEAHDTGSDST